MSGAAQPASSMRCLISGTAAAASGTLTVTCTSSGPASASSMHCRAVAAASAVSVMVIDWTTTGAPPPTMIFPTFTPTVLCNRTAVAIGSILPLRLGPAVPQQYTLDVIGARQRQGDPVVVLDPVHDPVEEPRDGRLGRSGNNRGMRTRTAARHAPQDGRVIGHPVSVLGPGRRGDSTG